MHLFTFIGPYSLTLDTDRHFTTEPANDESTSWKFAVRVLTDLAISQNRDWIAGGGDIDIGLPVMDGYELARRLRRRPGAEKMRMVAVTGYGQKGDIERALEAGFDEHLVKPVDFEKLEALLSRFACEELVLVANSPSAGIGAP